MPPRFVLFAGERLQYFIAETFAAKPQEKLDEGELKAADCLPAKGSRYGLLNDVLSDSLSGKTGEAQEGLEQYLMTEWMTQGLFMPE